MDFNDGGGRVVVDEREVAEIKREARHEPR